MTISNEGASLGRVQLLSTSSALSTQQSSFHSLPLAIPYLVTGTTYQSVAALHKLLLGITLLSTSSHHTTCSQPSPSAPAMAPTPLSLDPHAGSTPLANQVAGHQNVMSDASGSLVIKVSAVA